MGKGPETLRRKEEMTMSKNGNAKKSTSTLKRPAKVAASLKEPTPVRGGMSNKPGTSAAGAPAGRKPEKAGTTQATPPATSGAPAATKERSAAAPIRDARLPAVGTTLVKRDRAGCARCECMIEEGGIRYKGMLHRSLSAAASAAAADIGVKGRVNLWCEPAYVEPRTASVAGAPIDAT
jgi:hypothetical protein